jgi:hypothetical protein
MMVERLAMWQFQQSFTLGSLMVVASVAAVPAAFHS